MRIKQISVFLENTPGHLEKLCKVLAEAGVNLQTITIAETRDYGIVRAIVAKTDTAISALKEIGFFAKVIDVLAVEVEDKPGALLSILKRTSDVGLNIEYMYALTRPQNGNPVMVMSFKDLDTAEKILG